MTTEYNTQFKAKFGKDVVLPQKPVRFVSEIGPIKTGKAAHKIAASVHGTKTKAAEKVEQWSAAGYYSDVFSKNKFSGKKFDYDQIEKPETEEEQKLRASYIKAARTLYASKYDIKNWKEKRKKTPPDDMTDDELVKFAKAEMGWFSQNTVGMTTWFSRLRSGKMSAEEKKAFGYLLDIHDHTHTSGEDIWNFVKNGLFYDPTTYIGLGTLGLGSAAAQGAKAAAKEGVKAIIKASFKTTMTGTMAQAIRSEGLRKGIGSGIKASIKNGSLAVVAEGAITGGYTDYIMQHAKIASEVQKRPYSFWQTGTASVTGGILGDWLGGAIRGGGGALGYMYGDSAAADFIGKFGSKMNEGLIKGAQYLKNEYLDAADASFYQIFYGDQAASFGIHPKKIVQGTVKLIKLPFQYITRRRSQRNNPQAPAIIGGVSNRATTAPEPNAKGYAPGKAADGWTVPSPQTTWYHTFLRVNPYSWLKRYAPGAKSDQVAHYNMPQEVFQRRFLLPVIQYMDDAALKHGVTKDVIAVEKYFESVRKAIDAGMDISNAKHMISHRLKKFSRTDFSSYTDELQKLLDELKIKQKIVNKKASRVEIVKDIDAYLAKYPPGDRAAMIAEIDPLHGVKGRTKNGKAIRGGFAHISKDALDGTIARLQSDIKMFNNLGDGSSSDYIVKIQKAFDDHLANKSSPEEIVEVMKTVMFFDLTRLGKNVEDRHRNWDIYFNFMKPSLRKITGLYGRVLGNKNAIKSGLDTPFEALDVPLRDLTVGYQNPHIRDIKADGLVFEPGKPHNVENFFIFVSDVENHQVYSTRAKEILDAYDIGRDSDIINAVWHGVNRAGREGRKHIKEVLKELNELTKADHHANSKHFQYFRKKLDYIDKNFPHNSMVHGQRDIYRKTSLFFNDFIVGNNYPGLDEWSTPFVQKFGFDPLSDGLGWMWRYISGAKRVLTTEGEGDAAKTVEKWVWHRWWQKPMENANWLERNTYLLNPKYMPWWFRTITYRPVTLLGKPIIHLANNTGGAILKNPYLLSWPAFVGLCGATWYGLEELSEGLLNGGEDWRYSGDIGTKTLQGLTWTADQTFGRLYRTGIDTAINTAQGDMWFAGYPTLIKNFHPGAIAFNYFSDKYRDAYGDEIEHHQYSPNNWHLNFRTLGHDIMNFDGVTPLGDWPAYELRKKAKSLETFSGIQDLNVRQDAKGNWYRIDDEGKKHKLKRDEIDVLVIGAEKEEENVRKYIDEMRKAKDFRKDEPFKNRPFLEISGFVYTDGALLTSESFDENGDLIDGAQPLNNAQVIQLYNTIFKPWQMQQKALQDSAEQQEKIKKELKDLEKQKGKQTQDNGDEKKGSRKRKLTPEEERAEDIKKKILGGSGGGGSGIDFSLSDADADSLRQAGKFVNDSIISPITETASLAFRGGMENNPELTRWIMLLGGSVLGMSVINGGISGGGIFKTVGNIAMIAVMMFFGTKMWPAKDGAVQGGGNHVDRDITTTNNSFGGYTPVRRLNGTTSYIDQQNHGGDPYQSTLDMPADILISGVDEGENGEDTDESNNGGDAAGGYQAQDTRVAANFESAVNNQAAPEEIAIDEETLERILEGGDGDLSANLAMQSAYNSAASGGHVPTHADLDVLFNKTGSQIGVPDASTTSTAFVPEDMKKDMMSQNIDAITNTGETYIFNIDVEKNEILDPAVINIMAPHSDMTLSQNPVG